MRNRQPENTHSGLAMLVLTACTVAFSFSANAAQSQRDEPTAAQIVANMRDAMTPASTVLTQARIDAYGPGENTDNYDIYAAQRRDGDNIDTTLVFRGGGDFAGSVVSWGPRQDGEFVEAMYLPGEHRVREILPVEPNDPFLGTNFTRADLGFVATGDATYTLAGRERIGHEDTYKIVATLTKPEYYSRIVTWVSGSTWLPVRREYYDRANRLWKTADYQGLVMEGHPTITAISLADVQSETSAKYVVTSVHYANDRIDPLFRTTELAQVPAHPAWNALAVARDGDPSLAAK